MLQHTSEGREWCQPLNRRGLRRELAVELDELFHRLSAWLEERRRPSLLQGFLPSDPRCSTPLRIRLALLLRTRSKGSLERGSGERVSQRAIPRCRQV